jgi:hypothetical protein
MLLLLLGLLLALPLVLTTAFSHMVVVGIYAGLAHVVAFAWALLIITIIVRKHRIAEWRKARKSGTQKYSSQTA